MLLKKNTIKFIFKRIMKKSMLNEVSSLRYELTRLLEISLIGVQGALYFVHSVEIVSSIIN